MSATLGWSLPSGSPPVIAVAGPADVTPTRTVAASAARAVRIRNIMLPFPSNSAPSERWRQAIRRPAVSHHLGRTKAPARWPGLSWTSGLGELLAVLGL